MNAVSISAGDFVVADVKVCHVVPVGPSPRWPTRRRRRCAMGLVEASDQFGRVVALDSLHEGVVIGIADGADRWDSAEFGESFTERTLVN